MTSDIRRTDMVRVQLDDGTQWDQMTELITQAASRHSDEPKYEEIDLHRASRVIESEEVMRLLRRVGKRISFLVTYLNGRRVPQTTYAVGGILKEVALSPFDAAENDVAYDRIVIVPDKVVQL